MSNMLIDSICVLWSRNMLGGAMDGGRGGHNGAHNGGRGGDQGGFGGTSGRSERNDMRGGAGPSFEVGRKTRSGLDGEGRSGTDSD